MTTEIPKSWENKSRANITAKIPYAYKVSEDDPLVLVPDPDVVPIVEEAMDYLDQGHSYRNVAGWLTEKADRTISHQGIANIWKHHRGHRKSPKMKKLKEDARRHKPKTKAEEDEQKTRYKLRAAKRSQTVHERKLKKLQSAEEDATGPTAGSGGNGDDLPPEARNRDIIFQPNEGPQTEFLAAPEREVLYGGAAGGGKSYALLADPMRYFDNPNFNGLLLRRTNDELRELIWKSQELFPRAYPGAKWQEKKSQWNFPSGARLWMTYLERDEDVLRYQGQAFCVAEGTPVLMSDGSYKSVENLEAGEYVQTLEGPKPLEWVSQRLRKPCVKVSVYDAEGHLLCEQLQPYTHPIALLSSEPCSKLSDLSRNVEQFRSSPLQWLSAEHLESRAEETPVISSSQEDDQTGYTGFEGERPNSLPPDGYFYPAVLHGLDPQSGSCREATQCRTCGRFLTPLLAIRQENLESSRDLSRPCELDQSCMGHNTQLSRQSGGDGAYAPIQTQKAQGSQYDCPSCRGLCDEQSPLEKECGLNAAPLPDDVEGQDHGGLTEGEKGYTLSHSRYQCRTYIHPYTQEQRPLTVPASVGIVQVTPLTNTSNKNVVDLTVRSSNHYITRGGLVNKNCYIAFDELTQHPTPFAWNYMRSRLRTTDPDLPIFMRATSNPGGPGHQWVKKMFIDPSPAKKPFPAQDIDSEEVLRYPDTHEKAGQPLFYRRFIPATLKDNPYLFDGGQYEANLLSLPEMQRRQLLEGDWNLAEGAAFPEFKTAVHTCEPFDIPDDWRRFRSCDYGYSSYSAVHWFAIDPSFETLYVYRELYVSKHTGRDLGAAVMEAERGESIQYGVLDSSCWHQRGQLGPSIAEEMISMGCKWRPSDRTNGARVAGKNRLHELLKIDDRIALPGIIIFNNCRQIIADLPVIPSDPKGSDDIDPRYASDHAYDSVRYGIMSRPRAASPFEEIGKYAAAAGWRPADSSFGY